MGLGIAARQRLLVSLLGTVALTTASAAFAKKKAPTPLQEPVSCAEDFQLIGDELKKIEADPTETATVRLARGVIPQATDEDVLADAKDACWEVSSAGGRAYHMPAFTCIGEAGARAASLDIKPRMNNTDAYCAYQMVVELATRSGADDETLAEAHQGRGDAMLGLSQQDGPRAQRFTSLAIQAYEQSIELSATAARHFALGRIYIGLGKAKKAEDAITAGAELEPKGTETALALVSLAELKRDNDAPPEDVLGVLQLAKKAAPDSLAANGAIGIAYYELGKPAEARKALEDVIDADPSEGMGTDTVNYRAEAHYYMGLIEAGEVRRASDWNKVAEHAESAVKAGGGDTRFRTLVCLSHIARGGDPIADGDSGAWCEGQDTPEGQLMRGMYYLRRAQYVPRFTLRSPPSRNELKWREYLNQAEEAFEDGEDDAEGSVDWPGVDKAPELAGSLAFGQDVVGHANLFCRTALDADGKAREKALFDAYGVLGCKP
ncbi:MAG: hypothetical protein KTR31_29720 [Myxococcales bacterium]|nr:hypothetical protein [Myxococcales bacterium]